MLVSVFKESPQTELLTQGLTSQSWVVSLFAWVAAAVHLCNKDFRKPDKTPRTYIQEPDGCIDLDVSFDERTIKTTAYVKIDAQEQSEGVYRQLGIVTYHPSIEPLKVPAQDSGDNALVPTVQVQSLQLLPNQGAFAVKAMWSHPSKPYWLKGSMT